MKNTGRGCARSNPSLKPCNRPNLVIAPFFAANAIDCAISRRATRLAANYPQQNDRFFNGPSFAHYFGVRKIKLNNCHFKA